MSFEPDHQSMDERERLRALRELNLLDSGRDEEFDRLTELVADVFQVKMVALSLVDESRQWFKSSVGLPVCETTREVSFCSHTIFEPEAMVVEDALGDPRFARNPLVLGAPNIRFYAGVPLRPLDHHAIGTLCVIDDQPRRFECEDVRRLKLFARQCEALVRHHVQGQRLRAEQLLAQDANARYRAVFDESGAGIIRIDCTGRIQAINRHALGMLGHARDTLIGANVKRIIPARWASEHDGYLSSYLAGRPPHIIGIGREVEALHADGHTIAVHLAVSRVDLGEAEQPEFIGILTDLSALHAAEREVRSERALLRSIIDASSAPIFARDRAGRYIVANKVSMQLAGVRNDQEVSQFDIRAAIGDELAEHVRAVDEEVMRTGALRRVPVTLQNGMHLELTKSPMLNEKGDIAGVVTVAHDVTALHRVSRETAAQRELLSVLHQGLTDYQALLSGDALWDFLKQALRRLTESDYALIGEVVRPDGVPSLKIHAITDLSWSDQSRELMERLRSGDMMLTNPNSLLGRVFAMGETVITAEFERDPRRGGLPVGHPPLNNYLGVPIVDNGEVIGMYAIANSRRSIDEALADWLRPFTASCALLIKLYRGMEEQTRFTEALQQARDEQARANRAKTEFLSAMSHELRTPLNSILGFSQLLMNSRKETLSPRQSTQIGQIHKSGQHLLALINEVLDLARIDAGKMSMSIEPVSIGEVLRESLDTVSSLAAGARIVLRYDGGGACERMVMADLTRLRQVCINLLSNAIKYNREGGRVEVSCELCGDRLRIWVRDTGIGIPVERRHELFQPFSRLGAETSAIEGAGVGLALTRKLLDHMQGEIGVDSVPGEGSAFWFELPVALAAQPQLEGLVATSLPDTRNPVRDGVRMKVLYVEDNPANRRLMSDIFEDLPHLELICAASAGEGVSLARTHLPRLVIMDINLPDMDGFAARRLLAQDPGTAALPVIALSANAMRDDIERGLQAGFVDYLTKPVDIPQLVARVEALTGGADDAGA